MQAYSIRLLNNYALVQMSIQCDRLNQEDIPPNFDVESIIQWSPKQTRYLRLFFSF